MFKLVETRESQEASPKIHRHLLHLSENKPIMEHMLHVSLLFKKCAMSLRGYSQHTTLVQSCVDTTIDLSYFKNRCDVIVYFMLGRTFTHDVVKFCGENSSNY